MKDREKKNELPGEQEKSASFQHGSKERVHPFLKTTSNFVVYRLVLGKKTYTVQRSSLSALLLGRFLAYRNRIESSHGLKLSTQKM